jgi:ABC-2 type transport system ATP-binding protein
MNHASAVTAAGGQPRGTPPGTRPVIEVNGLRKSFGDQVALDGIDLSIPEGSVFALLGPNGAGKTTTVRILTTLSPADAGEARIGGHDVRTGAMAVRSMIGVTGQFSAVDFYLSAVENMQLMAALWHLPPQQARKRAGELLEFFELADAVRKPVFTFSGGMQRRLDLAMTLMGSPRILFLDEPTAGLDPRGRRGMWEAVRNLVRNEGVTVFLTTQYLEEADRLADHVAVLDQGKIVAQGTTAELKQRIPGGHMLLTFTSRAKLDDAARQFPSGAIRDDENLTLQFPSDTSGQAVQEVLSRVDASTVRQVSLHTPDLDDVFLALTGQDRKAQS